MLFRSETILSTDIPTQAIKSKKDSSMVKALSMMREGYVEIVHCVFEKNTAKPHIHDKITKYYAVGIEACESFKRLTGKQCEVLHNLLEIKKPRNILRLISATRLASDKGKIVWRMQQFIYALERSNIPYEWKIFTNGQHLINGKGIIYMQPTLDIRDYIADSDYMVQLSDTEAFCYSVLESLYLHIPVIVTPIPCFDEMGVENGKNGYILDFDMKNIPIEDIYNKRPKFDYQPLKNEWLDKIEKVKGNYKEELEMEVRVRALPKFEGIRDSERNVKPKAGEEWVCSKERADFLLEHGVIEIVEDKKEVKKVENVDKAIEKIEESAKETVELEKNQKKKKKTSKK